MCRNGIDRQILSKDLHRAEKNICTKGTEMKRVGLLSPTSPKIRKRIDLVVRLIGSYSLGQISGVRLTQ